jgi:Na+-driven multidrug efflux pump
VDPRTRLLEAPVLPALVTLVGALLLIPLSPCLIFGVGPLPGLRVAGGAVALSSYYGLGTLILAAYLWSGRSVVHPRLLELSEEAALPCPRHLLRRMGPGLRAEPVLGRREAPIRVRHPGMTMRDNNAR